MEVHIAQHTKLCFQAEMSEPSHVAINSPGKTPKMRKNGLGQWQLDERMPAFGREMCFIWDSKVITPAGRLEKRGSKPKDA